MKRLFLLSLIAFAFWGKGYAQSIDDEWEDFGDLDFASFRRALYQDMDAFRMECLKEFLEFLMDPWKEFEALPPEPKPIEEEVPPVVIEDDQPAPIPAPIEDQPAPAPVPIEEIVTPPAPDPQPQPIAPVEEEPTVDEFLPLPIAFYGNVDTLRLPQEHTLKLRRLDNASIVNALQTLSDPSYENLLYDCLQLRAEWSLCDWAYLQLLEQVGGQAYGTDTNEAVLMTAFLYMMSGYRMRLAKDDERLYLLYASTFDIYEKGYYRLDDGLNYYCLQTPPDNLSISQAAFPQESSLSLYMALSPQFAPKVSSSRTITSYRYPDTKISVAVNENLMDFYSDYPSSKLGDNFVSRWALYASKPLDTEVQRQIYPVLRQQLEGLSELEAVNRLLNLIQTGLEYEYDDKVWGHDRAFFPEESLFYPYADCEDRSILLTRMVRDLLDLPCILVYYPGHLATAIAFSTPVPGDGIRIGDRVYTIADPTIIGAGAPVGITMEGMDNRQATVIEVR